MWCNNIKKKLCHKRLKYIKVSRFIETLNFLFVINNLLYYKKKIFIVFYVGLYQKIVSFSYLDK